MIVGFRPMRVLLLAMTLAATNLNASAVRTNGAVVGEWTMDLDAAKKLAQKNNLPIILNFTGSDWCHWCIKIEEIVFSKTTWQDYAKTNANLVTLDFPRRTKTVPEKWVERNNSLAVDYGVEGFPTLVVLDSDASTILGITGATRGLSLELFIKQFEAITKHSAFRVEAYLATKPANGKEYKAAIDEYRTSSSAFNDWIDSRPLRNPENEKKFARMINRIRAARAKLSEF